MPRPLRQPKSSFPTCTTRSIIFEAPKLHSHNITSQHFYGTSPRSPPLTCYWDLTAVPIFSVEPLPQSSPLRLNPCPRLQALQYTLSQPQSLIEVTLPTFKCRPLACSSTLVRWSTTFTLQTTQIKVSSIHSFPRQPSCSLSALSSSGKSSRKVQVESSSGKFKGEVKCVMLVLSALCSSGKGSSEKFKVQISSVTKCYCF